MSLKHRIAVNLDGGEFAELAGMSDKYGVSLAWLGRQALAEFIARYRSEQLPLPLRTPQPRTDDHATA